MAVRVLQGDALAVLKTLPSNSVHCVVTSPPYFGLRRYLPGGHPDAALEMGSEPTPDAFIAALVEVFAEVRRVLRGDGVALVNMGDGYNSAPVGRFNGGGFKDGSAKTGGRDMAGVATSGQLDKLAASGLSAKNLLMMPARVALALQADGWTVRSQMPWVKRSCMPESVTDRPTSAIEYVYMLTKGPTYYWDAEAVKRTGAIEAGVRAAKGSNVRSALKDVNGRPPEYWDYTGTRNFRNSDLFFDSLTEPYGLITDADGLPVALDVNPEPFPGAHFACFPSKLVEPLVRAATSERGCCAVCGAPWERVTEKVDTGRTQKMPDGFATFAGAHGTIHPDGREKGVSGVPVMAAITTGWRPRCGHDAAVVPCTVLDPFAGAFTAPMVADRLQRHAIGIELSEAYCAMARARLIADAGIFADLAAQ